MRWPRLGTRLVLPRAEVKRIRYGSRYKSDPAWSPNGKVNALSGRGHIRLMHTNASHLSCMLIQDARRLAWAPDGKGLGTARKVKIYPLPVKGGRPVSPVESVGQGRFSVWSPDVKLIAFLSSPNLEKVHNDIYYIVRPDGSDLRRLTNDGLVDPTAWLPDDRCIAFVSRRDALRSAALVTVQRRDLCGAGGRVVTAAKLF
jgi:hypothetical protein